MEVIINEIMQALEITDIRYMYISIAIIIGSLILWRVWK